MIELMPHQRKAVDELRTGKILYGGVGSGKSLAALAYYQENESPKDIVIITTAKKRDSLEWEGEAVKLGISTSQELTLEGALIVESWNNIKKFTDFKDYFFIFDEQRLVGHGAWVKSFLKIAKNNNWILLSATPGDTWLDYAPVFIANGYFKNITEFKIKHVLYEAYAKYPKVRGYLDERYLEHLRNMVLIEMPFEKHTERIVNWLEVDYDKEVYDSVIKRRWNIFTDEPCRDIGELFRVLRRIDIDHPSRLEMVKKLLTCHDRLIIFYNFNFELETLRMLDGAVDVFEWNGHKKDPLPTGKRWVYLVQYVAGAEGWNCTSTDAAVMYSMTYSYKNFEQAQGRIDRLDTPYEKLYYYVLVTSSGVSDAIRRKLDNKKTFNERKYAMEMGWNLEF